MDETTGKTVFFTGRRPKDLVGYNRRGYTDLVEFLTEYIGSGLYPQYTRFISGGAQGFDHLAFWAVEKVRRRHRGEPIENILYLPFPGQASPWSPEGVFGRLEYNMMMSHASAVEYTSEKDPENYHASAKLLLCRNDMMASDASLCLALWPHNDDSWRDPNRRGGTANAMRNALSRKLAVRILRYTISDGKVLPICVDEVSHQGV